MTAVLPEALKLWVLGAAIGCSPSGVGAMASWKGKGRALPAGGNGALAGRRAAWQGCSRVGAMRTAQFMAIGSGAAVLLLEGACGALVAAVDAADSAKQERWKDWGRDRASRKCLIISRIRRMDSVRDPVNHGIQKICYRSRCPEVKPLCWHSLVVHACYDRQGHCQDVASQQAQDIPGLAL
jgi:hypothetical protein